jgi:tetratricopeptide (TPR) repeat protein
MPETNQIAALLRLERDEEQRFAGCLTAAERAATGTPEQPSPKDSFAHAVGAKQQMVEALVAARTGGAPQPSHDRDDLFEANAARAFASLERDAGRIARVLLAEVEGLGADDLRSSPPWIGEETLADEIVQQCVTHALAQMAEPVCARGDVAAALRVHTRFVEALPDDTSVRQRSRALYNLGCLYLRAGREDDAVGSIAQAIELRPSLIEHVRSDPDLEALKTRLA